MREEIIGDCRLILGDCRDVLPALPKVDAVVTDPPYGVTLKAKTSKHGVIPTASMNTYNDDPSIISCIVLPAITLCLQMSRRMAVTPGWAHIWEYPIPAAVGVFWQPAGSGRNAWGFQQAHPILYYGHADRKGVYPTSFGLQNPGGHTTGENKIAHPCQWLWAWMCWLVQRASSVGEVVVDPFMGSGTTGVACVELERHFIGIEIDQTYFDIACRRIEAAYKQPRLFPTGSIKTEQQALF